MANPQTENGYTRIANEIMEALVGIRVSGEARQVLDLIFRKTYGFQKKEDAISLSQFCLFTHMRDNDVCRAIKKLVTMNMISKKASGLANIYAINKDFSSWRPLAKKRVVSNIANKPSQKSESALAKKRDTKETITKERKIKTAEQSSAPYKWEEYLEKLETYPERRDLHVIGFYFREKGLRFETREQAQIAVRRHLRAAKSAKEFSDRQIVSACEKAKTDYKDLFTIETIVKILTR